jgi:nucleotide-binding universal stress UspA family protein
MSIYHGGVMEVKKLLYVTDIEKPDFSEVEQFLVLRRLGLDEVLFLCPNSLEDWERRLGDYGLKSRILEGEGSLLPSILDAIHKEKISIMAVSLRKGKRKIFGVSRIKKLLSSSSVPVIVLHGGARTSGHTENGIFHHCMLATDWSPVSETAINYLLNFREIIEVLEVVYVVNKRLSVRDMRSLKQRLVETRKTFLDRGIDTETHVYAGKSADEIMLAAKDYGATSIIMGTSGRPFIKDFFSRSCSYQIAEEATVPAFLIPFVGGK